MTIGNVMNPEVHEGALSLQIPGISHCHSLVNHYFVNYPTVLITYYVLLNFGVSWPLKITIRCFINPATWYYWSDVISSESESIWLKSLQTIDDEWHRKQLPVSKQQRRDNRTWTHLDRWNNNQQTRLTYRRVRVVMATWRQCVHIVKSGGGTKRLIDKAFDTS